MKTYPNLNKQPGQPPRFEKTYGDILMEVKPGGAIKILDPIECITDRQRRWYKGVCLPWLAKHDENQESTYWWDSEVKRQCDGLSLLKKEVFFTETIDGDKIPIGRLTTRGVGKRNMTTFINEILAKSVEKNWGLAPPDRDLIKENLTVTPS